MKPDLSNPDILSCYNSTALNYDLPTKDITLKNDIEVDILDPFLELTERIGCYF